MYKAECISQVNYRYIFFKDGKEEDRTVVNVSQLKNYKIQLIETLKNIKYMQDQLNKKIKLINKEINVIDVYIKKLEKYITENQNNGLIRRGLAQECFTLKIQKEKYHNIAIKLQTINNLSIDCNNDRQKYKKIMDQIDAVLELKNFNRQ